MKSKDFFHAFLFVSGMMLSVASCEKMNVGKGGSEEGVNVFLSVASFEQVPFSATRTAVSEVCSRLSFLVYDRDGTRIRKEDQQVGDEDFGQTGFMLAKGRYYLVVVAHSGEGNPTSTNARRIGFTNKTGYTDTFVYADSLTVDETDVERSLNLRRITAMVRFIPNDAVPAKADSIRFYYTGGSGTFDAVGGGWGIVKSTQVQWYAVNPSERQFDIYTIPHEGDGQQLNVTASTYRGNKGEATLLTECEIEGIPVKRNHITTCRGYLFSPVYKQDFIITIDDDWENDSIEFYF